MKNNKTKEKMSHKNSSEQLLDVSVSSTEIEGFDTNISLLDSFDQASTSFLKSKASALEDIILDEEDFNSTLISNAPKLCFKQSTIICSIPNFSL